MDYKTSDLEGMSRRELQALAKTHGIKANGKTTVILEQLTTLLEQPAPPAPAPVEEVEAPVETVQAPVEDAEAPVEEAETPVVEEAVVEEAVVEKVEDTVEEAVVVLAEAVVEKVVMPASVTARKKKSIQKKKGLTPRPKSHTNTAAVANKKKLITPAVVKRSFSQARLNSSNKKRTFSATKFGKENTSTFGLGRPPLSANKKAKKFDLHASLKKKPSWKVKKGVLSSANKASTKPSHSFGSMLPRF
jgi:hypothetical protein